MKIAIIGQGYVGLTLSMASVTAGYQVIGFDSNEKQVQNLKIGVTDIPNISKNFLLDSVSDESFVPTNDLELLHDCKIIIIAVPTPLDINKQPDLSFLRGAATLIATSVKNPALIINESTSYPGTLRNLIKPIIELNSQISFEYASAPERIDPANSIWKLENTPRLVSGLTNESTIKAVEFYNSICNQVYAVSKPEVAEAAKLFENSFRQINIALANEFSKIAHAIGFSAHEAIQAAATKPFGFLPFYPSIGVGGHCIPIDPSYLSFAANKVGVEAEFIKYANITNESMINYIVMRLKNEFNGSIHGLKIQVVGISYKPDVSDMRESPAIYLINGLITAGAIVSWHDPIVGEYKGQKSSPLSNEIDLGLIVSPHKVIDFSIWKSGKIRVFDLSANDKDFGWPKYL
jgi:UDP-N-acetyl-D-glucosamine dehydrogenase